MSQSIAWRKSLTRSSFVFALPADGFGALSQQAAEGAGCFGQGSVIRAMNEVLRDDTAFDIAMMPTADTQDGFVGSGVELAGDFNRAADLAQVALRQSPMPLLAPRYPKFRETPSAMARRASASRNACKRAMTPSASWCLRANSAS